ncbi:conserved oligomeric Golgi complex subunit 2 isoform X1 [Pristis pectinata]|uniref:conserved oligomeric Golgi complex subunit 2 isoform X1 n=1 Tax=Pristis pectinata TaxID=685728 RepID=UPI00223E6EE0|nr:conserved oligomeric Golgi complex subunit 2 isoform X1 [Pristis pectinata]
MEPRRAAGSLVLPAGSGSLCFNKDEFLKDDFDVDHFVSECRKHVQLETLRDDLELYYKLLKTAMVELINKDYADFVNLSTNLVGMDKALNHLTVPLGQLREEVMSLKLAVSEGIQAIDDRLAKEEDIRKKKMCVLRLLQVIRSVEKIEKILHSQSSKEASPLETSGAPLAGQMLERIGTEFNQLHFHAVQSKGMPLLDKVRPRIAGITAMLQQSLEGLLLEGLQTANVEIVRPCLRTYATIDKTKDAEALIGQVLVKPYVEEVICEEFVQSRANGLKEMYGKLLDFIPNHCRILQVVTGGAITGDKNKVIPGYDFTVNSVWPEMVRGLEGKLPSLFNPGNPDTFHEKYTITMEFIRKFEWQCASQASVKRLRSHSAYQSFHGKWSLSVYYQIRFKEIAGNLEASLSEGLKEAPDGSKFRLQVTCILWQNLMKCWDDRIFLAPLAHRFWKLTLQLLARYVKWVDELQTASSDKDLAHHGIKPSPAINNSVVSSSNGSSEEMGNGQAPDVKTVPPLSVSQLVYLVADLDKVEEQLPGLLDLINPRLENIGFQNFSLISEALADSQTSVKSSIPALSDKIIEELSEACFSYLKNASEVPRLYRRTNKEVPTKASLYVENALKPLYNLQSQYKSIVKENRIQEWLSGALRISTERYYETVSDVLSSVKKMEESLKRLKQARKSAAPSNMGTNSGISDDNKIRLQLALDVEYLWDQVQKLGLQMSSFTQFVALLDVAQAAKAVATAEPV